MSNLRNWKRELKRNVGDPDAQMNGIDTNHPECPHCGCIMNFIGSDETGDFVLGEAYWECSGCGFKIYEREL